MEISKARLPMTNKWMPLFMTAVMLWFSSHKKLDALHISYEKLTRNPEDLIPVIAEFCGLQLSQEEIQRVKEETLMQRTEYLQWDQRTTDHRIKEALGYRGMMRINEQKRLVGWLLKIDSTEAVQAKMYINGKECMPLQCNRLRKDLVKHHGSSNHGFNIDLSNYNLKDNDLIELYTEDSEEPILKEEWK